MNTTATAKVPSDKKRMGDQILREIGATPSQLINAAYDYVIAARELPKVKSKPASKSRTLSDDQIKKLEERRRAMVLPIDLDPDALRDLLSDAVQERYEAIS